MPEAARPLAAAACGRLLRPQPQHLPGFVDALAAGFTPDNIRRGAAALDELEHIARDAAGFLRLQHDPQAEGAPITLPDGRQVPRLPGLRRWIWIDAAACALPPPLPEMAAAAARARQGIVAAFGAPPPVAPGQFAGVIGLRWQPGTAELPPHVLGHCGYAVVPWLRRRGLATLALGAMLAEAAALGLPWIELTCDADNLASRRVIERCGGRLIGTFDKPAALGGAASLRFRIDCDGAAAPA
jgi:RimJ/RimL family protein N-acetyltransferase